MYLPSFVVNLAVFLSLVANTTSKLTSYLAPFLHYNGMEYDTAMQVLLDISYVHKIKILLITHFGNEFVQLI
jgi:predicted ATP-grasp superfamily ATP-dependent carboligase